MPLTLATSKLSKPAGIIATVGLWSYYYSIDLDVSVELMSTGAPLLPL